MIFLIDENLPARLCTLFEARGFGALHVSSERLLGRVDAEICARARELDAIVVTKDDDYRGAAGRTEARVLLLTCGNCTTPELFAWLDARLDRAVASLRAGGSLVEV